jgi:hypothetical protein
MVFGLPSAELRKLVEGVSHRRVVAAHERRSASLVGRNGEAGQGLDAEALVRLGVIAYDQIAEGLAMPAPNLVGVLDEGYEKDPSTFFVKLCFFDELHTVLMKHSYNTNE